MTVARNPEADGTRIGLITSRRVGNAVQRNRVRRRLREICRLHRSRLADGWLVVISARAAAENAGFAELRDEWLLLAGRLSILPDSP